MPFLNFNNRHFTEQERTDFLAALANLQNTVSNKLANLTTDERQQYGSINEQNKLVVNKVKDYRDSQPQLSSPDVDWDEFANDYATRSILESSIEVLKELMRGLENAKILHDWDNYQAALSDYEYTKYKDSVGATGYHTKSLEIKQFFNRSSGGNTTLTNTETPQE